MKLQIFLRVFGLPVLLGALLVVKLNIRETPFDIYVDIVFFASILILSLISDKKYIKSFTVTDDYLLISYITNFLTSRQVEIQLSGISQMKLSKRRLIQLWSSGLNIKADDEWHTFQIISKKLYLDIQDKVDSGKMAFVKQ